MTQIQSSQSPAVNEVLSHYSAKLDEQVNLAAAAAHKHLEKYSFEPTRLLGADPAKLLPFKAGAYPVDAAGLGFHIPNLEAPSENQVAHYHVYASAPENYGTAPAEMAALLEQMVKAINPETAFVFGTGRGRLEQIIAESSDRTAVVSIDLPSALVEIAPGKPDTNNIRYRTKIGISDDSHIGDICRNNPVLAQRVTQLLGDSFTAKLEPLRETMRLVVVDGNHDLPNALMDMANALDLAHRDGGVILIDDFKKPSPLNMGVDAAAVIVSQCTKLPIPWPTPKPGEKGFTASAAIFVVPADFNKKAAYAEILRSMAKGLKVAQ
jgi:predicted O-methyltransferase YrrM